MAYTQKPDEERFILECCSEPTGRLLEIGAWNPRTFSNSRALIERGWEAVLVEPSPMPMHELVKEYGNDPKITLVCAALGMQQAKQLVAMHVSQDAMTTCDENTFRKWSEEGTNPSVGGYYGSFFIPSITFADIFLRFGGGFDFVSIDAEGISVELLKNLLYETPVRPHCICFEHDNRFAESFAFIQGAGYHMVYENDCNRIVRRNI